MKLFSFLRGLGSPTNTKKAPDYSELSNQLIEIGARASLYPRVAEMGLKDLHSYRIFIEGIDAIGKTLSGVHAKFGVALIGGVETEDELNEKNIYFEEREEIIRIVHEAIQAELVLNEIISVIKGIDSLLNLIDQDKNKATQVASELKNNVDEFEKGINELSRLVDTTSERTSKILGKDFSLDSLKRPAFDILGQINKAESDLKNLKREVESLQEIFSPWIQERLDAVKKKREEAGLELKWAQLFYNSEK